MSTYRQNSYFEAPSEQALQLFPTPRSEEPKLAVQFDQTEQTHTMARLRDLSEHISALADDLKSDELRQIGEELEDVIGYPV